MREYEELIKMPLAHMTIREVSEFERVQWDLILQAEAQLTAEGEDLVTYETDNVTPEGLMGHYDWSDDLAYPEVNPEDL